MEARAILVARGTVSMASTMETIVTATIVTAKIVMATPGRYLRGDFLFQTNCVFPNVAGRKTRQGLQWRKRKPGISATNAPMSLRRPYNVLHVVVIL